MRLSSLAIKFSGDNVRNTHPFIILLIRAVNITLNSLYGSSAALMGQLTINIGQIIKGSNCVYSGPMDNNVNISIFY